ncbi:MAG: radical SAM protein [Deltaproteobacteria bacterium]|nr:radical SAM protein [Deltaproteobacteria bacterium]MBW2303275.1 radical SAM protein [Deltaproteobacteria bacterium]
MRYEGPIYRPPSEADSLLIQATVGCPHNKCTFCMIYKKGPPFRIRPVEDICEDLREAREIYGEQVRTLFFPAGNTIAMPSRDLARICRFARKQFPFLERITVYGSSRYIAMKGPGELEMLREAGLTRIHVGLESGDDEVLRRVKKGTDRAEQILAGRRVKEAGMELSEYVILGLGGVERTREHAKATAEALNAIGPDFVRLRTLVPKINTLLLHQIRKGRFRLLSPHQVLEETRDLLERLSCRCRLTSDHYTNYINLDGEIPRDRERLLAEIDRALAWSEDQFRPFFIGTQ